jgi:hypothetical protein
LRFSGTLSGAQTTHIYTEIADRPDPMLKWFAPLLLLAGKPEVLLRLLVAVLAGVVLFFGVWLISNIAVTFDTLKNPAIAAAYAVVLLLFFVVVGTVAWLRLRRLATPSPRTATRAQLQTPPLTTEIVGRRAKELAGKWDAESRRADRTARKPAERTTASPQIASAEAPQRASAPALATLTVTGPAYAGKTALIARLVDGSRTQSPDTSDVVGLTDAGPIDGDDRHVEALVAGAARSDGVLFVVDQDLRAPEVAALKRLLATGKPLYVVLNKADQFSAGDRDAILVSIRAKMPKGFAPGQVVAAAGAPAPVEREIEDARGAVRVELRRPSSDVAALVNLLSRAITPGMARPLRFERAS